MTGELQDALNLAKEKRSGSEEARVQPEPTRRKRQTTSLRTAKQLSFRIFPEAHYQLKRLALDENTSIQALCINAVNMLFESYQLHAIADPDKPAIADPDKPEIED